MNDFFIADKEGTQRFVDSISDYDFIHFHMVGMDHVSHVNKIPSHKLHTNVSEAYDVHFKSIVDEINKLDENAILIVYGDHGSDFDGKHGTKAVETSISSFAFVYSNKEEFSFNQQEDVIR